MTTSSPLPLRGERFADPSARAVWAAIAALPPALQHLVLDELRALLGRTDGATSHDARVRHAVTALRECAQHLGRSPSVGDYRTLRATQPTLDLPPDGTLRRWLGGGSWNDCLRQARLDCVPDGDVVVAQLGAALGAEEAKEALQECARDLKSIPTLHAYLAWARRPDVRERPGRRPQSVQAFNRLFGGFRGALVASGVINDASIAEIPRSTRVRLGSYFVDETKIRAALQEVARRIAKSPRVKDYIVEREAILSEVAAAGELKTLPAPSTIQKHYGTWDAALEDAGLSPLGGRATRDTTTPRRRPAPRISTPEIIAALVEAYAAVGDPFTSQAYRTWRAEQVKRDQDEKRLRRLPSYDVVWTRLGSWGQATAIVERARKMKKKTPNEIAEAIETIMVMPSSRDG